MVDWKTDALALACILGGASVGGATTVALLRAGPPARADVTCVVASARAGAPAEPPTVIVMPRATRGPSLGTERWEAVAEARSARVRRPRAAPDPGTADDPVRIRIVRRDAGCARVLFEAELAGSRGWEARGRAERERARAKADWAWDALAGAGARRDGAGEGRDGAGATRRRGRATRGGAGARGGAGHASRRGGDPSGRVTSKVPTGRSSPDSGS
jgi:hypothetical protein